MNTTINRALIYGFLFGAVMLPVISVIGLIIPYLEYVKPLLIVGKITSDPLITQISANTYEMPLLGWVVYLGVNGILYAAIFALVRKVGLLYSR
jgi:hypothetical protein